jgi:2-polyprenyl-6-methoxyphenol hydroxylase-like FAD-dependent oxidoreductase
VKIAVAGAGPAGLLFALLAKRRRPDADVQVFEQNAADATFGFGVVFSHGALEFLARDAPVMHATLSRVMETWPMQRIVHRDTVVDIDGNGFCAIGRLALLTLLQRECADAGVRLSFGTTVDSIERLAGSDLVVAADGVNSRLRSAAFGTRTEWLTNKFAWYGTGKPFDCLTLTFRESEHGAFVAHHYRYAPDRSTFIVECDAATWRRAGLGDMDDAGSRAYCETVFAPDLDGHPLVSNRSIWRNFPLLSNARWSSDKVVLIGDALRTGHFSIGSGTRLAFDDAIALDRALGEAGDDVPALLAAFERERRPVVDKLVAAANSSSYWYERMADKMALDPVELAYDYMTRSGRVDDARLREMAPRFMREVEAARPFAPARIVDPVPRDAPGAREVAFTVPERYNASSLLYENVERRPDKIALLCGERAVSYAQLAALADKAGAGMRSMGIARGGRVLMLLDDTPEYVAAIFGALRAGLVPVLVNTLSPPELVAYYLSDSGAEAAFIDARFSALLLHEDVAATRLRQIVHVGPLASDALPQQRVRHEWKAWIDAQRDALAPADTHRDDMAFWMYSSGSTGRPKGVVHLHHDALYTWKSYGERVLGLREDDVVFSPPKIFFAYGFGNSITFPFAAGATTVLMPGRPEPEAVFATIERHRPTVLFGLPTLYVAMPRTPDPSRATCRACACACPPRRPCRRNSSTNGSAATGLRSSKAWGPPKCFTSTCPIRHRSRSPARAARRYRATSCASPIPTAATSRKASRASCGCAGILRRRAIGVGPTRRLKRCATAGSIQATAFGAMPTDSILRGPRRRPGQGQRAVGATDRGGALPRREPAGARVRRAGGRGRQSAHDACGVRGAARRGARRRCDDLGAAALREVAAAALQVSARDRVPARAAEDRHRQDRPAGAQDALSNRAGSGASTASPCSSVRR